MKLSEQEYFVLKFTDGTYFNSNFHKFNGNISEALRYEKISNTLQDKHMLVALYGLNIEIIPIRVTIKEIKRRDLLCYFVGSKGWDIRTDDSMGNYWKVLSSFYEGYGALTD